MNVSIAPSRGRAASAALRRLDVVGVALVCLPILVHAVRAAAGPWVPIGDDAYFTVRSLDVGTSHHPLVGAWSSGSVGVDRSINNLGPIQLDLLAPFTRFWPYGGTAVGVAVVQIAAIVTTGWLLGRIGGPRATVAGMVPIGLLAWTMGSEMLITPRQHQYLVLVYLCFLVAAWAAAAGDRWAAVPLVATASLLTQTHLSYPVLVAVVGLVAAAGQFAAWRASSERHRWYRPWAVAAVLAVVLWVQTAIDQVAGFGNFTDVVASPGSGEQPGWGRAAAIVGATLLDPRTYVRRGFATFDPDSLDGDLAVVAVILLVAGLAAGSLLAGRTGRRRSSAGLAVATAAVVAAVVDASQLPVTVFGLTPFNYRWLWSTGTLLAVGVMVALAEWSPLRRRADDRTTAAGLVAVSTLFAVANLPVSLQVPDPVRYAADQRNVAELVDQLSDVDLAGPVVIDQTNMYFGHPYGYPTALVLRDRGIEYRFVEAMQERRFGADRVADGSEPTTLVLWAGDEAVARFDDPATVVYVVADPPIAITMETT